MSKKLLTILGIILLLTAFGLGIYAFTKRNENNELLKNPTSKTEAKKNEVKSTPQTKVEELSFNKKKYSIDDPKSPWVVVNKSRPLNPLKYVPEDLISVGNDQMLRKEAADALALLINAAKTEGLAISALSGYRSFETQVTVYGNEVKNYGQTVADSESAKPGTSEHQTGLGVDVGGGGCGIEDCFGNTAEGKWLAVHAYEYGFIVRYTAAKQSITGYRAEPWHIRYVGTELSQELHETGVTTLEEFFNL